MTEAIDRLYEQVLVLRFQAGDDAAFAEIVERYHERLRHYLRGLADDESGVEDVLQEVWIIAFRNLAKLRRPGALPAWLYRVARNAMLAEHRRGRAVVGPLPEPAAAGDIEADPEFTRDDAAAIRAGLDELSSHHREVLVLRYFERMSYEEIADIVGCPLGTVRSRVHNAKQLLGRALRG